MTEEASTKNLKGTVAKEGIALGLEAEGCPPQLAKPIAGAVVDKTQSSDAEAPKDSNNTEQASNKDNEDNSATKDPSGMVGMVKELGKLVATVAAAFKSGAQKATSALSNSGLDDSASKAKAGSKDSTPDDGSDDTLDTKPDNRPSMTPRS